MEKGCPWSGILSTLPPSSLVLEVMPCARLNGLFACLCTSTVPQASLSVSWLVGQHHSWWEDRDADWRPAVNEERGEYLLRLDDGVEADPKGESVFFDLVTTETYEMVQRTGVMHSSTYTLLQYLEATGREPPEHCLQADEDNATDAEVAEERPVALPDEEETAAVKKEITDKLLRGIRVHHATMFAHRRTVLEQGLRAHEQGAKVFWEVYSGEAGLSMEMQRRGSPSSALTSTLAGTLTFRSTGTPTTSSWRTLPLTLFGLPQRARNGPRCRP